MRVDYKTTLGRAAELCGGKIITGDPSLSIDGISSDSRDLGENALFIPLVGEKFNGHDFIADLVKEKKISAFLSMNKDQAALAESNGIGAILCDDTLGALGNMAAAHRSSFNVPVIGITGTNGKTTSKEMLHALLSARGRTLKNEKNYNNEIGVPFTLLGLDSAHEFAVIEMGMNHSGELDRLSRIVRPDTALITNVGEGHLEFLGSIENVAYAKAEIMHGMESGSVVFINRDTNCFDLLKEQADKKDLQIKTFGLDKNSDFYPEKYTITEQCIHITFRGYDFTVPLYGIHNVYNIMGVTAVALETGADMEIIEGALKNFQNVDGRSRIIDRGYIVIDDTYNANPLSTRSALQSAAEIFPAKRKTAVLSDMKELGRHAESFHRECGKDAAGSGFDSLYLCGEMSEHYREGAVRGGMNPKNIHVCATRDEIADMIAGELTDEDVVLVKGSRSTKMEEVVRKITE